MRASRHITALCASSMLLAAQTAAADDKETAKNRFDEGVEHMEAGRYDAACPAIEESHKLNPLPGTLFTLAECEANRGRIATAMARYDEYLALYATLPPDRKAKQGKRPQESMAQKAALAPQVPELTLVLPANSPRETAVTRDGQEVGLNALGVAIPVDPGEHTVTTQAPGGALTELRVTVGRAEKRTVILQVKDAPGARSTMAAPSRGDGGKMPPQLPPAPADTGSSARRIGMYVAGGVGLAGLVLGGVTGALTLANKATVDANCVDGGEGVKLCKDMSGVMAGNRAKQLGLASTVGFSAGAAGLGLAAVLFFTGSSRPSASRDGSTGRGEPWIDAAIAPAGQPGVIVGWRRAW